MLRAGGAGRTRLLESSAVDHRFPAIRRRVRALCTASVVLAVATLGACAQAAAATQLTPIVVSATTYAQALTTALPGVSVITRRDIEDSGANNLITLLQQVAGVQIASYGGPGESADIFLRGFSGPDVLVLIDGMPMNAQDASGNAYLSNLSTREVERVEIIRGNVSAIYGSGAVGGVVLITTRAAGGAPRASVSIGAGSHATESAAANVSDRFGRTEIQAGLSRYVTQGIASQVPAVSGLPDQSDGYRNNTAHLAIRQRLAPQQSVGLSVDDSDGKFTYDNATAAGATHQNVVRFDSSNRLASNWTSRLSLGQQRTDSSFTGSYALAYLTRIRKLEWRNVLALGAGWTATGGVSLQRQSISSSGLGGIPAASRRADAVFGGIDGTLAGNQLQFNVRRDDVGSYGAQDTAYLGWGRVVGGGFKVIASASTAFNAPPLGYLYYQVPGVYGTEPNPALRPEKARSLEAGLQWSQGGQYLRATVFQTKATDQWAYVTVDPTQFIGQFRNVDSARTRGLEVRAHGTHGAWRWHGNLTEQDPVNTSPGAGGATLPLVAHTLANAGIGRRVLGTWVQADARYAGPREDPYGPRELGAYAVVDLAASRRITAHWRLSLRVNNLFDRRYATHYGYQSEPLGVYLSLRWTPSAR